VSRKAAAPSEKLPEEKPIMKDPQVVSAKAAAPSTPIDEEDDYLPCSAYKGHNINDKQNNVALFKHENGQFYFVLYHQGGQVVKLRSEGFPDAKGRDQELAGVLKYHNDRSMYKRKSKGAYYMDILYDKTGREVGRSCLQKEAATVTQSTAAKTVTAEPVKSAATAAAATAAAAAAAKAAAELLKKPLLKKPLLIKLLLIKLPRLKREQTKKLLKKLLWMPRENQKKRLPL